MYSITASPAVALDLAHSIQEEHLRQAGSIRRTPKQPKAQGGRRPHWWPTRPWTRPVAVA